MLYTERFILLMQTTENKGMEKQREIEIFRSKMNIILLLLGNN